MALAIDEIYRTSATGKGVAPSSQAKIMLSAIGKMLSLENLKMRAGYYKRDSNEGQFFLEGGDE